jgi:hypothetical protein
VRQARWSETIDLASKAQLSDEGAEAVAAVVGPEVSGESEGVDEPGRPHSGTASMEQPPVHAHVVANDHGSVDQLR